MSSRDRSGKLGTGNKSPQNFAESESSDFRQIMESFEQKNKTSYRPLSMTTQIRASTDAKTDVANEMELARKIALSKSNRSAPDIYKKPGLQNRELQRLKQGKISTGNSIDLHGNTVKEALPKLAAAIQLSRKNHLRCILVICGKGLHSQDGKAVLSNTIRNWLIAYPDALAYCPAKPWDGDSGALYVLLKAIRNA